MPASKCNYLIVYENSSQVYSTTNLATALKTPLPTNSKLEERHILFVTYMPDEKRLCVNLLEDDQIEAGKAKIVAEEEAAQRKAERKKAAVEQDVEEDD